MTAVLKPRAVLEQAIEALIAVLDTIDPDPDLEPAGDDEPDLGWTDRGPSAGGINNDCEQDDADLEDGGDAEPDADGEPWLAGYGGYGSDQDLEADVVDEPHDAEEGI